MKKYLIFFCLSISCAFANLEEAKAFFLPDEHPLKTKLEDLFSKKRLLDSFKEMEEAGFTILKTSSELHVATHPELKGFVIKFYLDSENNQPRFEKLKLKENPSEIPLWLLRIHGAIRIQNILDKHHLNGLMKVSRGWIFPLPIQPQAKGPYPKQTIFVEEDMDIVNDAENERKYRQEMTFPLLKALYTVLLEGRFYDSVYIDNNPFSLDGKIAFVDTEEYDRKAVPFDKLLPYFSFECQIYWKLLTSQIK